MYIPSHSFPVLSLRTRRGLTLIELITVISVIAILAGILIAMVGGARDKANTVKSASNLREIHRGLMLFVQSNNNQLPELWNQQPPYTNILHSFDTNQEPVGTRNLSFILHEQFDISPQVFICPAGAAIPKVINHYRVPFSAWAVPGVIDDDIFYPFGQDPFSGAEIVEPRTLPWMQMNARANPQNLVIFYDAVVPGNPNFVPEPMHGGGRINMLFLDGSVRTLRREDAPDGNRDFDAFRN